jgi:hypothetical protein
MAGGVSPSLICNPSGQISAEMQAGIDELKTALGIEDQDADEAMDCEDCIASLVFIPTSPSLAVTQTKWTDTTVRVRSQIALIAQPRGPPLGPRAPPPNL